LSPNSSARLKNNDITTENKRQLACIVRWAAVAESAGSRRLDRLGRGAADADLTNYGQVGEMIAATNYATGR